jgi:hypothetical protein
MTADKQWIQGEIRSRAYWETRVFLLSGIGSVEIPLSLLDQLRRDAVDDFKNSFENISVIQKLIDAKVQEAKKELLDEYVLQLKSFLAHLQGYGCASKHHKLKRRIEKTIKAKTLGEKKE